MKRWFLIAIFFILTNVISSATSFGGPLKIGVFDMQMVLKDAPAAHRYRQEFMLSIEQKRKPLFVKEESIRKMEERLKNEGPRMAQDERKSLGEKIESEIKELRRQREDIELELKKIDQNLTLKIMQEMQKVIEDIAKKENYDIIIEKHAGGIAFVKETHDITKKIINGLK
ncbi:MAG TPA: OmpH family outer membrane protein [Syntrophorhabdaceae bacterium]|nr:OmpH family outer membrane protein [Syntrophorhabdaceae bacterium]